MVLNPDLRRLRKLSPGALADEAGALKAGLEAIKEEAIRRGIKKVEGELSKLSLSPPSEQNRTDKAGLLRVLGITESEYVARFTSPVHIDWTMRITAKKAERRAAEDPQPVLPNASARRVA
jgi:hypothetical protein